MGCGVFGDTPTDNEAADTGPTDVWRRPPMTYICDKIPTERRAGQKGDECNKERSAMGDLHISLYRYSRRPSTYPFISIVPGTTVISPSCKALQYMLCNIDSRQETKHFTSRLTTPISRVFICSFSCLIAYPKSSNQRKGATNPWIGQCQESRCCKDDHVARGC